MHHGRFGFLVAALILAGCVRPADSPDTALADPAALPGLRQSSLPELQEELRRIEAEGGAPRQLDGLAPGASAADPPPGGWEELFPPETVESQAEQAERLLPEVGFAFSADELRRATEFRRGLDAARREARTRLADGRLRFRLAHSRGLLANPQPLAAARLAWSLEAILTAEVLAEQGPAAALDPLGAQFDLCRILAAEKHVGARLRAAQLRARALEALAAVIDHPQATAETARALLELVQRELAAWPPDADTWFGDRALGLHTYEFVRAGEFRSLISEEELADDVRAASLEEAASAAVAGVDADEAFYLRTLRRLLDECRRPYHERTKFLTELEQDLESRAGGPDDPVVAGLVLLRDLRGFVLLQAADRARGEAWANALAAALGEPPPHPANPLSGAPFQVDRVEDAIVVRDVFPVPAEEWASEPPPIRVRWFGPTAGPAGLPAGPSDTGRDTASRPD